LLPPNDSFSFSSIINIPSGVAYAMRNKDNEVIIWPSKAFSDNDYSNNFYRKIFYFKDFTGIATVENELLKVSIMPNPTKEKLNISCDDLTGSAGIKIFNAIGTKVYEQSISNLPLTSINIATWAKGIYFLQMNYKGRNKMMKFVVE
jgi:hypothetical protein